MSTVSVKHDKPKISVFARTRRLRSGLANYQLPLKIPRMALRYIDAVCEHWDISRTLYLYYCVINQLTKDTNFPDKYLHHMGLLLTRVARERKEKLKLARNRKKPVENTAEIMKRYAASDATQKEVRKHYKKIEKQETISYLENLLEGLEPKGEEENE